MKKKLTYRQQQFLSQFLDVYRETGQSVHYVEVARRLGIGNVTAYEMLRLLEERGLVQAEYQSNPEQHGPGRATVLFYPTAEARLLLDTAVAGDTDNQEDWREIKEQILNQLRDKKNGNHEEVLNNLLSGIPKRRSPLIFVTELITIIILMLETIQEIPEIRAVMQRLRKIGLPQEISLNVLSGIAMFISVLERTNRSFSNSLLAQVNRYEEALAQLNEESRLQVSEYTREVVQILSS